MSVTKIAFASALMFALPFSSVSAAPKADNGDRAIQRAQKQKGPHAQRRVIRHRAPAVRHPWPDPSLDRNGRPYKPNFYDPCTVDLGYGRFASCDSWDN